MERKMGTTFALVADLWRHIGPGIALAFALPVLLGLFGLVLLTTYRRVRGQ
jgi:hypothetical protein